MSAGSRPDRTDDFERGLANRRAVLGDAWVDKSLNGATEFNAEFQDLITRYAWNDIWGRPGLDHDTRRLLVLGMTMALARWENSSCTAGLRSRAASPSRRSRRRSCRARSTAACRRRTRPSS
jgi:3-oxoadipate enol-lactonase